MARESQARVVLRRLESFPLLVLEEPEAHLHPKVQRTLARVIARLVNKGVHVWITTHSTTFCQQINNLIKLGPLPKDRAAEAKQKWGYTESDCLRQEQVGGYQLMIREDNGRTAVTELTETTLDSGRRKQSTWTTGAIFLESFEGTFRHERVPVDERTGRGTLRLKA